MYRRTREAAASKATFRRRALGVTLIGALLCTAALALAAGNPMVVASQLSNQAFALLNSLDAPDADGNANPGAKTLLGPVATFAGDAQTLSQALGAGDKDRARRAVASLDSDAAALDAALKEHRGAIEVERWNALKRNLAAIEKEVPPAPAPANSSDSPPAAGEPGSPSAAAPGAADLSAPVADGAVPASEPMAPAADDDGPTIKIESRNVEGSVTHLKGYFEGSALRSAGIYEGEQKLKSLTVEHVIGRQKVEFQLSLGDADIATNLRVVDQAGRMATASVFAQDSTATASTSTESGVEVDRGAGSTSSGDTAEIPSASAPPPEDMGSGGLAEPAAPADEGLGGAGISGGLVGAPMSNIQINIEAVNPMNPVSRLYQVVGQIIGHGVHRAGIYIDGRLVKRLPVSRGSLTNFATTFRLSGGTATIRAFSTGNQYVETSIAMPTAPPMVAAPYGMNPYGPFGINPYAMDPFGNSYGSPYGIPYGATPSYGYNVSPYGVTRYPINPYVASPYGAAPINPYAAPINPYGGVPPTVPAGR